MIDWLPGGDGDILMMRENIPDGTGTADSRLVRRADGLGVDRINIGNLRATPVVRPDDRASTFMSDGRGNVRIRGKREVQGSTGMMRSRFHYQYRPAAGGDWRSFSTIDETEADFVPVAIDP